MSKKNNNHKKKICSIFHVALDFFCGSLSLDRNQMLPMNQSCKGQGSWLQTMETKYH